MKDIDYYQPSVFDCESLFTATSVSDDIANWGFPKRSSILITGTPGSGKSFLALSLARGVLFKHHMKQPMVIYYLAAELDSNRIKRVFSHTGWFSDNNSVVATAPGSLFANWESGNNTTFSLLSARVDLNRPVPTSEELVNSLLVDLRDRHSRRAPDTCAIVIVDSLTAILRNCTDPGEERRQAHEFISRLEHAVGEENLGLTFFISEETFNGPTHSTPDDYVVDFVFRVAQEDTGGGRRLRTLEVIKSHGANMRLGRHTWSIISNDSAELVLANEDLRQAIRGLAVGANELSKFFEKTAQEGRKPQVQKMNEWGTAVIYAARAFPKIADSQKVNIEEINGETEKPRISSGIPGLDEMMYPSLSPDHWVRQELGLTYQSHDPKQGLLLGSTTLISGSAGAGKTNMCLQFLLGNCSGEETKSLFINFELPYEEIVARFPPSKNLEFRNRLGKLRSLFRRRGNLDINCLLTEVRFMVNFYEIERIAIDGLSSLLSTTTKDEYSQLIERLLASIEALKIERGTSGKPITLFLTYEPEEDQEDLTINIPRLSALADNIIMTRSVFIDDEIRRAVFLAKARGSDHDRTVREIKVRNNEILPVAIVPGLESYTGLLSGKPSPVSLALQLFHENQAEEDYNRLLEKRLTELFNYEVKIFGFSRNAIARTLAEISSAEVRLPASHVRVFSLDEWWIHDIGVAQPNPMKTFSSPLLDLSVFRSADTTSNHPLNTKADDFWIWDIDKCKLKQKEKHQLVALPLYADYGIMCINDRLAYSVLGNKWERILMQKPLRSQETGHWKELVTKLPKYWACRNQDWFDEPGNEVSKKSTFVNLMHSWKVIEHDKWGFVFDLATPETACAFFLELCWAFGATENTFFDHKHTRTNKNAVTWALRLLVFLVQHKLMPSKVSLDQCNESLFSRHYYSTFSDYVNPPRCDESKGYPRREPVPLVMLPFFPSGFVDATGTSKKLRADIEFRVEKVGKLIEKFKNDRKTLDELHIPSQGHGVDLERTSGSHSEECPPPLDDEFEFSKRHDLRNALLDSQKVLPDFLLHNRLSESLPTGYCSSGAWMVAVHSQNHSTGLSCKVLDEMTSLESNYDRAAMGAGIPCRKDFFQFYGDNKVTNAPYLTWSQLLLCCGSRARQRQRATGDNLKVGEMTRVIHQNLKGALREAGRLLLDPQSDNEKFRKIADDHSSVIWASLKPGLLQA